MFVSVSVEVDDDGETSESTAASSVQPQAALLSDFPTLSGQTDGKLLPVSFSHEKVCNVLPPNYNFVFQRNFANVPSVQGVAASVRTTRTNRVSCTYK